MNTPIHSEEAIFQVTLEMPESERAAYLEQACGDDIDLRHRVEQLIAAHVAAAHFMKSPRSDGATSDATVLLAPHEKPSDHIDRYKLLQEIGEGGFGTVWMAEQTEPVRRRVALKIIKLGMDTREVVARFEAERQALAMMDHPNIAKVLDAGATPAGRPYFVMELVRGVKITDYCDQANLSTADRLKLFIAVCHAVQHAHQKGVIHRDLKPSNILVTLHDGVPVPKVIDFGVAKATQQRLTDLTLFTQFEQMIGTPLYMSPEQAEMSGLDIDTRTDVYALGVLLYELLTGRTPFDPKELMKRGIDEIRRAIREQEPPRPSTALSTMEADAMTTVAQHRHSDGARLIGLLRGDLDWIVMKAIEKDRTRRYDTANAFAEDIQRHLGSEPVVACPPSFGYKAGKFIRKHKAPVTTAAIVVLTLIAGLFASTVLYLREKAALSAAEAARLKADASEQTAKNEAARNAQTANFMASMLRGINADDPKTRDITLVKGMLDAASVRMVAELKGQPEVESQLRQTIGGAYAALGLKDEAERQFSLARGLGQSTSVAVNSDSFRALRTLAELYWQDGKVAEAEILCRQALEITQRLLGAEHLDTLDAMDTLAWTVASRGRPEEAATIYEKELALSKRVRGPEHTKTLDIMHDLGFIYNSLPEKYPEAEMLHRQVFNVRKRLLGPDNSSTLAPLSNLAWVLLQQKKYTDAESLYLSLYESVKNHDVLVTAHNGTVLHMTLADLVSIYRSTSRPDEAAKWQQKLDAYDQAVTGKGGTPVLPKTPSPPKPEANLHTQPKS